jgi:PIN domain nuclease of toxin-antitoxin system
MTKDELINKIKAILKGIDEDECVSPDGWWETSESASFGKTKLAEVINACEEALAQNEGAK